MPAGVERMILGRIHTGEFIFTFNHCVGPFMNPFFHLCRPPTPFLNHPSLSHVPSQFSRASIYGILRENPRICPSRRKSSYKYAPRPPSGPSRCLMRRENPGEISSPAASIRPFPNPNPFDNLSDRQRRSVGPFVNLKIRWPPFLRVRSTVRPFVRSSVRPFVRLSVRTFVSPSVRDPSVSPSVSIR